MTYVRLMTKTQYDQGLIKMHLTHWATPTPLLLALCMEGIALAADGPPISSRPAMAPAIQNPRIAKLVAVWKQQESAVVSGRLVLMHFWWLDNRETMSRGDVRRLLGLDGVFDPATIVARSLPRGFPSGDVSLAEWGRRIEIVFESNKLRNTIARDATSTEAGYHEVITFDGKHQVVYGSDNSQSTIHPAGRRPMKMFGFRSICYVPDLESGKTQVIAEGDKTVTLSAQDTELTADTDTGFVRRVLLKVPDGRVSREIVQVEPRRLVGGAVVAGFQVGITMGTRGVRIVDVCKLVDGVVNVEVDEKEFRPSAPIAPGRGRSVVVDLRGNHPKVAGARHGIDDVMKFANGSGTEVDVAPRDRPKSIQWIVEATAIILGLILLIAGLRMLRSRRRRQGEK